MPTTIQVDGTDVEVFTAEELEAAKAEALKSATAAAEAEKAKADKAAELEQRLAEADKARTVAESKLTDLQKQLEELKDSGAAASRVLTIEKKMAELLKEIETTAGDSKALGSEEGMKKKLSEVAAAARREAEKKADDLQKLLDEKTETTGKELRELKDRIEAAEKREAASEQKARSAEALVVLKDAGLQATAVALAKKVLPDVLTDEMDLTTEEGRKALTDKAKADYAVLFASVGETDGRGKGKGAGVAGKTGETQGTGPSQMDRAIRQAAGQTV